ncbi:ClpX C4-type zinc finger protein [Bradyrhizobium sp. BR 10289]|uniref:ClpX C4-type zinc finger protein n=1 Tax=Bradyrhizobium sp. BR 10289 TaxID=2749993 RepID=UPI001C64531C|nr:ClpX C4-type zinc finger protein [Bradyrhizobium sp. BR 10289]MBW7972953.1 AAA family ATPase [Bradyrhizobium sp. BR 10289]
MKPKPSSKESGSDDSSNKTLYCSFCGKSQHEVRKLIAGPTVFICDECVDLCGDIIREENRSSLIVDGSSSLDVHAYLAKKFPWNTSATELCSLLARPQSEQRASRAARILLSGPIGCGASELILEACNQFKRPFFRIDASSFRPSQWRGSRDPFRELLASVDFNVDLATHVVVLLENIEFLCRPELQSTQEELSSILRGDEVFVSSTPVTRRTAQTEAIQLSTEGLTFVVTTTLPLVYEPERGWVKHRAAGSLSADASLSDQLIACGISAKIVSEFSYIERLQLPSPTQIYEFLTGSGSDAIEGCVKRLSEVGITAEFSPDALGAIAKRVNEMHFGLKSVQALLSRLTLSASFETGFRDASKTITIEKDFIERFL